MIKCNYVFEGYFFEVGRKYIYAKSYEQGKSNEKRLLTVAGKQAVKEIAKIPDNDYKKHIKMGEIWHNDIYSVDI